MEASKEKKKVTFAKAHSNKNKVKNGENEDFIPIPKTNSCKAIWQHLFLLKRDLKGFKCMTVSLDVFEDIPRLIETSRISRLSNRKNFNFKFLIFCESFHYFANQSYIL